MIDLSPLTRVVGRSVMKLRSASPELLTGVGVVGVIGTVVLAAKATLKLEHTIDVAQHRLQTVDDQHLSTSLAPVSETAYLKDKVAVYANTALDLARLYGPAIVVGVTSISCLIGSNRILRKRNTALMAAYSALQVAYDKYRERVIEDYGEDYDRQARLGTREEMVKVVDADTGEKQLVSLATMEADTTYSPYARFFDESSALWEKNAEQNMFTLTAVRNVLNQKLKARGHLFLNEVYDALGLERSSAGQVVGWIYESEFSEAGDGFVDFGIHHIRNKEFVNGHERTILIDFNVDGVIYDKI